MIKPIKWILPIVATSLFATSCATNEKKKTAIENTDTSQSENSEEQEYILPQPITLASAFKDAGLTYIQGKTNLITNESKYSKKMDQLLNLGIFSTDLAYCAINNKSQEAREYLTAIQKIGSKVGLESVFADKDMIARFDKNLANPTELENLIYDIQEKSEVFMEDNDLKYLAAVQFAGAWVEGIYLGIEDSRKKSDLGVALVGQMSLLKNIIKGLETNPAKEDKRLQAMLVSFKGILSTYNSFKSVKAVGKNVNVEVPNLSAEEFETLAAKITTLRNEIINPTK